MASIFKRGGKLYAKVKDANGKWQQLATGFDVGDEVKAKRWADKLDRETRDVRARREINPTELTLRAYTENWLARRSTSSVRDDATRLRLHVYPVLGDMLLTDVRPRHARDLIMALRAAGDLAPTTIRQVSGLLHTVFKSALIEELVLSNPIVFERGVLPKKVDKDPTWRHEAIYARVELEQLLFDQRIIFDRRVLYALKSLGALRHTEAAELGWWQYEDALQPLGALNLGLTKSGVPRRIPVHPTLAALLDAWRREGWPAIYGRAARRGDLVVPTRQFRARSASESQKQLVADLGRLDLRQRAGAEEHRRNRRGHDLRRTFITIARADGAADSWLRWITHGPRANEMLDVYSTPPWEVLCAEIAKVRIRGAVLVQSPQAPTTADESERPLRDSKAFPDDLGDTGRERILVVEADEASQSDASWQGIAPNHGEDATK